MSYYERYIVFIRRRDCLCSKVSLPEINHLLLVALQSLHSALFTGRYITVCAGVALRGFISVASHLLERRYPTMPCLESCEICHPACAKNRLVFGLTICKSLAFQPGQCSSTDFRIRLLLLSWRKLYLQTALHTNTQRTVPHTTISSYPFSFPMQGHGGQRLIPEATGTRH